MNRPSEHDSPSLRADLSALIDDELGTEGRRFLLSRLGHDNDLNSVWERYHLAGDCLRRQRIVPVASGFADRIARAVAAEPVPADSRLLPGAGLLALAASLALALLLVLAIPQPPRSTPPAPPPDAAASAPAAEHGTVTDAEFEAYLVRHHDALRQRGLDGFVPFVDLVAGAGSEAALEQARRGVTELR